MNLLLNNHETQMQNFLLSTQRLHLTVAVKMLCTHTHARMHASLQNELTSADGQEVRLGGRRLLQVLISDPEVKPG